ncbi:hypothetical protein GCM10010522_05560 [Kribbella solani]
MSTHGRLGPLPSSRPIAGSAVVAIEAFRVTRKNDNADGTSAEERTDIGTKVTALRTAWVHLSGGAVPKDR